MKGWELSPSREYLGARDKGYIETDHKVRDLQEQSQEESDNGSLGSTMSPFQSKKNRVESFFIERKTKLEILNLISKSLNLQELYGKEISSIG